MTFEESSISQWLYVHLKDKVDNLLICNPTYVAKKPGAKTDFRDALHCLGIKIKWFRIIKTTKGGIFMDLIILNKKLDGFRVPNGSIREVSAEVLWELRQSWENFTGPIEEFRSGLGVRMGTLRNLLSSAKRLNHVMASASSMDLGGPSGESGAAVSDDRGGSLVYDLGQKAIYFPNVDTLIEFLKRAA